VYGATGVAGVYNLDDAGLFQKCMLSCTSFPSKKEKHLWGLQIKAIYDISITKSTGTEGVCRNKRVV
jgi:hypothetical protein